MISTVIIPAGGSGKRFGSAIPKQFLKLNGKEVIIYTLEIFDKLPIIDNIIIAIHPAHQEFIKDLISKYKLAKVREIVIGGKERQDSVRNALTTKYSINSDIIMVHDAVRPFVSNDTIHKLIEAAIEFGAAVPGVIPKNTIKRITNDITENTIDRNSICEVFTPQVFKYEIIKKAFEIAYELNYYGTDSSSLLELIGLKSKIVFDSYDNFKITTPFDMKIAEFMLQNIS